MAINAIYRNILPELVQVYTYSIISLYTLYNYDTMNIWLQKKR